jgi:hypothetical protein
LLGNSPDFELDPLTSGCGNNLSAPSLQVTTPEPFDSTIAAFLEI